MKKEYDTIVIGGGFSGLSAAYTLAEHNRSVLIMEKEPWLGGRASSLYTNGYTMERGGAYLVFVGKTAQMFIEKFGMHQDIIPVSKKLSFFYDNTFHELDFSSKISLSKSLPFFKPMKNREKLNIRFLIFLINCITAFREIRKDYKNFQKYNTESAYDYAIKYMDKETIEDIFEPISQTFLLAPLKDVSAAMFQVLVGSFVDTSNSLCYLKHGFSQLAEKIEMHITKKGVKIRHAEVRKICRQKNKFVVHCSNGYVSTAKSIILATPIPAIKAILPDYKKIVKKNHLKIEYVPIICSSIALKEPLKKLRDNHIAFFKPGKKSPVIFMGETTKKSIHVAPAGRGLLYVLLSPIESRKYIKKSEKKIAEIIDDNLDAVFPDYVAKKLFSVVFKWKNAFILTDIKYFTSMETKTNIDGLFLCGDHVYVGIDGVMQSGVEAGSEALKYLK